MKKQKKTFVNIFLVFATVVVMGLSFLSGCSKVFSFNGSFDTQEYVMKVGDTLDPRLHFSSDKAVVFSVPEDNILASEDDGTFTAQKPGKSYILAKSGSLLIDRMDVYVKYSFPTPINLRVDNDGVLSWDESALIIDGKVEEPTYRLQVKLNGEPQEDVLTDDSFYQFTKSGNYEVKVKAEENDRVLGSDDYSKEIVFGFDLTTGVTDFVFNSKDDVFGSQKGILAWQGEGDFVLTLDGMQYDLNTNSEELDFSSYNEGVEINAKVLRKEDEKLSKSSKLVIKKIATPELKFVGGELVWDQAEAREYFLLAKNSLGDKFVKANGTSSVLEGVGEGVYELQFQAIGQQNNANGNVKNFAYSVGKIDNVEVEYEIEGENVNVTFSTEKENNKRFVVTHYLTVGGEQVVQDEETFDFVSAKEGDKYVLSHTFALGTGKNTFAVQAIPTIDRMMGEELDTTRILKSDILTFDAYNLAEITNLHHSLGEDDSSILTFDKVEYANEYSVEVNGTKVEKISVGEAEQGQKTTINIGKLTKDMGEDGKYKITLTANRTAKDGEKTKSVTIDKELKMLDAPTMQNLNGSQLSGGKYSWEEVRDETNEFDVAKYKYELYLVADNTYDTTSIVPTTKVVEAAETEKFSAGYYVIKVKSLPLDEDSYLPSEDLGEDKFYFAQALDSANIRIDKAEDLEFDEPLKEQLKGYVLSIQTVENGYKYEVFVDNTSVGSVFDSEGKSVLYYEFGNDYLFDVAQKNYKIEVKVTARDDMQQRIHLESIASVLNVSRLSAPSSKTVDGENLTVDNKDSNIAVELLKDGTRLNELTIGGSATVSLEEYVGDFEIGARYLGYQNFAGYTTNGEVKLDSDIHYFKFHRSDNPKDFNYSNGKVTFTHEDKVTTYVLLISVSSLNNEILERRVEITSGEKEFDLEEKIADLRKDPLFESAYLQKRKIEIKLYAEIAQEEGDTYYLSSKYATLKQDAYKDALEIKKLNEVDLHYNEEDKCLYWNPLDAYNVTYAVFYNEEQKGVVSECKFSIDSDEYNFSEAGEYKFYVVAQSDNSLKSDPSKQIIFHKLKPVDKLNVFERDGKFMAMFTLDGDLIGHITKVWVNNVNIAEGISSQRSAFEFELNSDSFEIYIEGENFVDAEGDRIHYISSDKKLFTLKSITSSEFNPNIKVEEGKIKWSDFSSEANTWLQVTPQKNIKYDLNILSDGKTTTVENIAETELSLLDPRLLGLSGNILSGDCTLSLTVHISEYEILSGGSGYYGRVELSGTYQVKKHKAVENLKATLSQDVEPITIDAEYDKKITLTWNYTREGDQTFEIYVNGVNVGNTQDNQYVLSQDKLADKGTNIIEIYVYDDKSIRSDASKINIFRFSDVNVASFNDDGSVAIEADGQYDAAKGYIVGMTVGEEEKFFNITSSTFNLQDYLGQFTSKDGLCSLRIIHKATDSLSGLVLPSKTAAYLERNILKKPNVLQTETGLSISVGDEGSSVVVRCVNPENGFEETLNYSLSGMFLPYPEDWDSGTYEFVIYSTKEGYIDSYKLEKYSFNISRISNIEELVFTKTDDGLDYTLSWEGIENADHYLIEVWKGEKLHEVSLQDTSILLSELTKRKEENIHGDYTLRFTTFTQKDKETNATSQYVEFVINIAENSVSEIGVSEMGEVTFEAEDNPYGFHAVAEEGTSKNLQWELAGTDRKFVVKDNENKTVLTGRLKISIVQKSGTDSEQTVFVGGKVMLDSGAMFVNIDKLQDIVSISKNATDGDIEITVQNEDCEDRQFYIVAQIGDGTVTKQATCSKVSDTHYEIKAIEICALFPQIQEGEFKFNIFSTANGMLRSEEKDSSFNYQKPTKGLYTTEKLSETEDYFLIHIDWQDGDPAVGANPVDGNITKLYIYVIAGEEEGYLNLDVALTKGYWISGDKPRFSVSNPEVEAEKVYALNMAEILTEYEAGEIIVKVGFVKAPFTVVDYSDAQTYNKLSDPQDVRTSLGNVSWKGTSDFASAYMLYFENDSGNEIIKQSTSMATYYRGEDITKSGDFYVAVQAVSDQEHVIPSQKVYYMQEEEKTLVHKLTGVKSTAHIYNGVISLDFDGSESDNTLEKVLSENKDAPNWEEATNHLMRDRLAYPFDYSLKDLGSLKLNVKFVSKDKDTSYLTTVNAVDILSMLKKDTLKSIQEINSASQELAVLKSILSNEENFRGVASSTLAFDEIGPEGTNNFELKSADVIPAGTYDIYLQQQGTDETLSSSYTLALKDKQVVEAPKMYASSETKNAEEFTKNYYINFTPVGDYTSYTFRIGTRRPVVYTITKKDNGWYRSKFPDGEVQLTTVGNDVQISLNDPETGIIYEDGIKYIYDVEKREGDSAPDDIVRFTDLSSSIFVNGDGDKETGDGSRINGKSDIIYCHFLSFQIDSLKINDGRFSWSNESGRPTSVIYKLDTLSSVAEKTEISGRSVTWSPAKKGEYKFIKFATLGVVEDSKLAVWVDSPVYTLTNVYKLTSPTVQVIGGEMKITPANDSADTRQEKRVVISNNVSEGKQDAAERSKTLPFGDITHKTGVNELVSSDESYKYALTERDATKYYVSVGGDTVREHVDSTDENNLCFDYSGEKGNFSISVRNLGDRKLLLQSERAEIDARKLENGNPEEFNVQIENGNIKWTAVNAQLSENQILVYEVEIEFLQEVNASDVPTRWEEKQERQVFYTEKNELSAEEIRTPPVDPTSKGSVDVRYIINVLPKVFTTVPNIVGEKITTLEGTDCYLMTDALYGDGSATKILDGELLRLGTKDDNTHDGESLKRRSGAVLTFAISGGELTWTIKSTGGLDEPQTSFNVYKVNGDEKTKLFGEAQSRADNTDNKKFVFVPDARNDTQLDDTKLYNFAISAFDKDLLASPVVKLSTESVKILPIITTQDYLTSREDADNGTSYHTIDFTPYFTKLDSVISGETDKVSITLEISGATFVDVPNVRKLTPTAKFKLNPDSAAVTIVATVKINSTSILNPYKSTEILLNEEKWTEGDGYYFDSTSQQFYWTYGADLVYTTTADAQVFKDATGVPIGLGKSESGRIEDLLSENFDFWPIQYEGESGYYVDAHSVVLRNQGSRIMIYAKENSAAIYLDKGISVEPGKTLTTSQGQPLDLKSWKITKTFEVLPDVDTYYLPLRVLEIKENSGENYYSIREDTTVYMDEDCTKPISIPEGTELEYLEKPSGSELTYLEARFNGATVWLRSDQVRFEYKHNEDYSDEDCEQVYFRVEIQTSYSYDQDNRTSYDITTTRVYNNVPIGEKVSGTFNGIFINGEIYVTSFAPNVSGKITRFLVQARKGENNLLSDPMGFRSNGNINIDLFGSYGEGNSEHPYRISSVDAFNNMQYREKRPDYLKSYRETRATRKRTGSSTSRTETVTKDVVENEDAYRFIQTAELTLNVDGFKQKSFGGNYDGQNNKINIVINSFEDLSDFVTNNVAVGTSTGANPSSITFSKGAALFEEITASGEVKNLTIGFAYNFSAASSMQESVLIGGIAVKNNGKISGIKVAESAVTFKTRIPSDSNILVAPIVGQNNNTIEDISSSANVDITNNFSNGSQKFYYGGLIGFNSSRNGNVTYAVNSGNISIKFNNNINGSVIASGVAIASSEQSSIQAAWNSGNIDITCVNGSAVGSGVCGYCVNSNFNYNVNTGTISAQYAGGIMFYFRGANFGNLVAFGGVKLSNNENTNVNLIAIDSSQGTANATSYSTAAYKTNSAKWNCSVAPEGSTELSVSGGSYKIHITRTGDNYSAQVTKS